MIRLLIAFLCPPIYRYSYSGCSHLQNKEIQMIRLLIAFLCPPFIAAHIQAAELIAGPMVGHTTPHSAHIWVETDGPAKVQIAYWMATNNKPLAKGTAHAMTGKDAPHTAVVKLAGLNPNAQIHYEVRVDNRTVRPLAPQVFHTFPTVPENDREVNFMVAFGSCMNPSTVPHQPIWEKAAQYGPAAFLYIGDINYLPSPEAEFGDREDLVREVIAVYHRGVRHLSGVRTLMATTPSYGIWDDHDYGPNNSDRTFRWRGETLEMYNRFWANPSAGTPDTKGVFYAFEIADVEFFMLDNRYHRDPAEDENRKTMFGQPQLDWLKNGLKQSTATFKVIVQGGSSVTAGRGERWSNWGTERDDFLRWMFGERISGVLFLAGDWHVGTLNRLYRPGDAYPLYELLSSNSGVRREPIALNASQGAGGHHQSAAKLFRGYNFGALYFSGKKGERSVALQIIDEKGTVQIHRQLTERDLMPRGKK